MGKPKKKYQIYRETYDEFDHQWDFHGFPYDFDTQTTQKQQKTTKKKLED